MDVEGKTTKDKSKERTSMLLFLVPDIDTLGVQSKGSSFSDTKNGRQLERSLEEMVEEGTVKKEWSPMKKDYVYSNIPQNKPGIQNGNMPPSPKKKKGKKKERLTQKEFEMQEFEIQEFEKQEFNRMKNLISKP